MSRETSSLPTRVDVLVIGSGAGGAATAATLADRGSEVVILEEGPDTDSSAIATNSPEAIATLYRNAGLTPIVGTPNIAYVEGSCVGGSTEVNSAFWHRLPADSYRRWQDQARIVDLSQETLEPYFDQLERDLSVSYLGSDELPPSSRLFKSGIEKLRWEYTEVPRCQRNQPGKSAFAAGNKQSMQRTYIPRAVDAGARLFANSKALRLEHENGRVKAAMVARAGDQTRIVADTIFVCGGAVQSAALLRRSGITRNIGNNLCIHPMLKAAAVFEDLVNAQDDALPIFQVKEFWPDIAIGGSVFTPGFLAMLLADNWDQSESAMQDWRRTALYYTATRGTGRGTIRPIPGTRDSVLVRYRLTEQDRINLSRGLAHMSEILFASGATKVFPSLRSYPAIQNLDDARAFERTPAPAAAMSLSTVHAFSSCPMGENPAVSATNSFGKVVGYENLYINDASLLPDSPGVNPQGTIMAIALRNLDHFADAKPKRSLRNRAGSASSKPDALVTGAPGWLGSSLIAALLNGVQGVERWNGREDAVQIRCLTQANVPIAQLQELSADLDCIEGDLCSPDDLRTFCKDAEGAVLFHVAGLIHPRLRTIEHDHVNIEGTENLVRAAIDAGVRRIVAVSSNSPFGFNPSSEHRFDENSPYNPYMSYGRSKQRMEVVIADAQDSGKIETVVIRPPWFYGPYQPPRQTLFFRMIRDGRFPVLGDGSQMRSMAYVDNICQGLVLAARSERANGEAYWIADERPYSIREIVDTVREVLEQEFAMACSERELNLPRAIGDIARATDAAVQAAGYYHQKIHVLSEMGQTIACSIDKARRELGYAPQVSLRDGMVASVRWCREQGLEL